MKSQLQKDWGSWSPWGNFLRRQRQIDELLYSEIRERRQNPDPERTDILSLMLLARDEDGQPMTDRELPDELMTLVFAGHDSTATALVWALYWIHTLPEVREKLLLELHDLGDNLDPMAIARLPYLNAVCSETLRIYPVVPVAPPRIARSPVEIMGHQFDTGTWLFPAIYLTHHRPSLYPQPKKFKPERFLERNFSPYEFFPFGGGNRTCIGMAFAQFEMKLVLATILWNTQLEKANRHPVKPVRRGVTIAPNTGPPCGIRAKSFVGAQHQLTQIFTDWLPV